MKLFTTILNYIVATATNPGCQILSVKCSHFNGDIGELVNKLRSQVQDLFNGGQLATGVPVLLQDSYDDGEATWTPTVAATIASTITAICAENNTPQALFITEQNRFRTIHSTSPKVPTNSWFDAHGALVVNTENAQLQAGTEKGANNQQAVGASAGQ